MRIRVWSRRIRSLDGLRVVLLAQPAPTQRALAQHAALLARERHLRAEEVEASRTAFGDAPWAHHIASVPLLLPLHEPGSTQRLLRRLRLLLLLRPLLRNVLRSLFRPLLCHLVARICDLLGGFSLCHLFLWLDHPEVFLLALRAPLPLPPALHAGVCSSRRSRSRRSQQCAPLVLGAHARAPLLYLDLANPGSLQSLAQQSVPLRLVGTCLSLRRRFGPGRCRLLSRGSRSLQCFSQE
mmetsp:Transcript_56355/g.183062  ORF Transcript_56355/g.183062 Transcript_56355/m.183062 type:complete len:239 (-) Transcript_56355:606-1322(-)